MYVLLKFQITSTSLYYFILIENIHLMFLMSSFVYKNLKIKVSNLTFARLSVVNICFSVRISQKTISFLIKFICFIAHSPMLKPVEVLRLRLIKPLQARRNASLALTTVSLIALRSCGLESYREI